MNLWMGMNHLLMIHLEHWWVHMDCTLDPGGTALWQCQWQCQAMSKWRTQISIRTPGRRRWSCRCPGRRPSRNRNIYPMKICHWPRLDRKAGKLQISNFRKLVLLQLLQQLKKQIWIFYSEYQNVTLVLMNCKKIMDLHNTFLWEYMNLT